MTLTIEIERIPADDIGPGGYIVTDSGGKKHFGPTLPVALHSLAAWLPEDAFESPKEKLEKAYAAGKVVRHVPYGYDYVHAAGMDFSRLGQPGPAFNEPENWEIIE